MAQVQKASEAKKLELQRVTESDGMLGFGFLLDAIAHELAIFWGFTWRDFSLSVIPGTMYTLGAIRSLDYTPSLGFVCVSLARSAIYFLVFIYAFDLANQINGLAEDRINKPDRPLPSGLVSLRGAYVRWYLTTLALLGMAAAWGVLRWAAMWVAITIYTSWYGGDKHWTTKNLLFMSVGSLSLLTAAWEIAAPITPKAWSSMLQLSAMSGVVASVQDMRDAEGDKVAGRRTLPILLGANFRWVMASIIAVAPLVGWKLQFIYSTHRLVGYWSLLLMLAMFYLAYRVVSGRTKAYHHGTYMVLTYIYCGCLAVPMLFP
ncbi:UbiA prenyltransferase family-domain-containing protein [Mycena amicta]|nr:UbiA prenyltransferase family-domain-containing protein [Mycena amicta]